MQEKHICHPNPIWGLCRKPLAPLQPVASPTPLFRNACTTQQKTKEPNQRSLQGQMLPSSVLVSVPHLPFSCPGPLPLGKKTLLFFFFSLFSLLYGFYSPTSSTEHSCPQGALHGPWAAPWVRAGAKESQSLKCALHQDQEAEGDNLSSLQGCAPAVKPSQEATDVKQPR